MANFTEPVSIFMSTPAYSVPLTARLEEVQTELGKRRLSSLAVVEGDELVGVVSRTDLLRVGRRDAGTRPKDALLSLPDKSVDQIMTRDVLTVALDAPLHEAAAQMVARRIHRIYVRAHGDIVGVISTRDLMLAIRDVRLNKPIEEFMSSPVFTVRASEPISLAAERLEKAHVSGLVAVDEHGWPVGIFTQREALESRERPRDTLIEDAMSSAVLVMPPRTAIHRAAAQAAITKVRRVVAVDGTHTRGILTGLDFARALA